MIGVPQHKELSYMAETLGQLRTTGLADMQLVIYFSVHLNLFVFYKNFNREKNGR